MVLYSNAIYSQLKFPEGTRVKVKNSDKIYLVLDQEFHVIGDTFVYNNLYKNKLGVKTISQKELETLVSGLPLIKAFLCKTSNPAIFIVINGKRRQIASTKIFDQFCFDANKIKLLEGKELSKYSIGKPIEIKSPKQLQEEMLPCGVK